ncbi:sensor histidine kinase [Chitinophaga sp. RAB17]|uniref:sensor histidine kinase n=1 Tax=Chitinophaga sp. RAB17 TaxID=3233049 RepID=UPI003F8FD813
MKKTVYLLLLLCLPYLLPAQDKPGYFALKPGDWFDMQTTLGTENGPYASQEPVMLFTRRYVLRYLLLRQLPNGNQQYSITQERIIFNNPQGAAGGWMGSDSYYPVYQQGLDKKPPKGTFLLEINAAGKIVSLEADKKQPPLPVTLADYSPQTRVGVYATSTYWAMQVEEVRPMVQEVLDHRSQENGAPLRIPGNTGSYSHLLIAASFPVNGNVLVKGILKQTHNEEATIQIGDSTFHVPVNDRGEFSCSLLLTKPETGYFFTKKNTHALFLMPGDTLIIHAAADTSLPMSLTGNAAWSCKLADDISSVFDINNNGLSNMSWSQRLTEVFTTQETASAKFNTILKSYEGKATPVSLDYYKTAWKYRIADDWLIFLYTHNFQADSSLRPFQQIPEIITSGIDNMPVLMNPYPTNYFYTYYLDWFLIYQKTRIGISAGGGTETFSFYSDYFALLSTLKGYPLYFKLAKGIHEELMKKSWTANQRLKPYFEDFIHNCDDSSLTAPIIKDWQLMEHWAPGNRLPFSRLPLANGKTYEIDTKAGKTTCVIFEDGAYYQDTVLVSIIKRHPEVSFVFAWIQEPYSNPERVGKLSAFPNVTCIELQNKGADKYAVYGLSNSNQSNVVVLDQWGRIVDDHIPTSNNVWKELQNAIDAAAKMPRLSTTQKSNMMNIIGWSLGSILLTALAGIWIYRVRIRNIKAAEATKTAIRELEVKAIRSQMNPHFIFNALNSIQSLINTAQYKAANTYLVKFSLLLRSVLHNAEKNTLPLIDELNTVRLYCELEQLRFDFSFDMDTAEEIAVDLVEIPGMILQPLVENAIIHGIAAKGKAGSLHIKTVKKDATLLISVHDNGNGFYPADIDKGTHKSMGLKLVRERLQLFSIAGQSAHLHISNGNGTTALLTIPIETA